MTPEAFGQKVKAKYPEYANMDDRELAQLVIAKYPEYASQVQAGPEQKPDFLDKASDVAATLFPGTREIGESVVKAGANLKNLVTGGVEKYQANLADNTIDVPALAGAYTAAGASAAGSAGAGAGGGVLAQAFKQAGLGAVLGAGDALADDEDAIDGLLTGAATGGAVSLGTSGAGALLKSFASLPQRLIRSATGQSKAEILAGKDISQYVIENKKIGSAEGLIVQAQKAIDDADAVISTGLKSAPDVQVPLKDIVKDIATSINGAGGEIDDAGVLTILESLAPQVKKTLRKETLSLAEANQLRSQLDKTLGNRAFINAQLPYNKGILMDFTNAMREQVKSRAPEGVRGAFSTLSKEIKLRDLLEAKVAQGDRNQIIGLGDLLSGGFGAAAGGIPGAIATAGVKRAAESTLFKTGAAVTVDVLDRTLSPILSQLEPSARTAITNAIVQAFSEGQTDQQPPQE